MTAAFVEGLTTERRENAADVTAHRYAGTWIEVLPHLDPKFGGMSAVVPQLASRLVSSSGYAVSFAAFCSVEETVAVSSCNEAVLTSWPAGRLPWLCDARLRRRFNDMLRRADGVHIHGLWESSTNVAASTAQKLGRPYILSAHGMLEPWALESSRWKKKVYSTLRERANIEGADCLHALTHAEAQDYRRFGSRRPIAVIPNGVEVPPAASAELFLRRYPAFREKRIVLYLGRIHPKKGLDLLVDAWKDVTLEFPDALLVIAGPDTAGTQAALEKQIGAHRFGSSVVFTGMLHAEMKWSALAAAHCFVLPSHSEGLSVAALEAMGLGVPVIVTSHCHMPEVATSEAGIIISADVRDLYLALETMLTNEPATHAKMGRRGKQLVRERFSWNVVARQMAELYAWVQGGARPRTVELLQVSS